MSSISNRVEIDADATRTVFGTHDSNLRAIAEATGTELSARGSTVIVRGEEEAVAVAASLVEELSGLVGDGVRLRASDLAVAARLVSSASGVTLRDVLVEQAVHPSDGRRVLARTPTQRLYVQTIRQRDIVLGIGPAGTGKTYLAVALALESLRNQSCRRIVLSRPAVEAGERLGFLPGDLEEKVNPYLRPLHDALRDLAGSDLAASLSERGTLEVAPLALMRGRTLNDAFIILDEAQNATAEQMKMFLTRMGMNSQVVVTGDITQIDLPREQRSGLVHASRVLSGIDGIEAVRFGDEDVVRHRLVRDIVRAYERDSNGVGQPAEDA